MDPSLLREREAFLKKAKTTVLIEKPRVEKVQSPENCVVVCTASSRPVAYNSVIDFRSLEQRHLERDTHPLSVDEILEETMLQDTPQSTIKWATDGKFVFKPRYDIRTRQELYQLLRKHESKGLGGIYFDDLAESISDLENVINSFGDHVIRIVTPHDKKTILFYNDKSFDLNVDDEFKQQWRSVSVEGVHETKIEEYLKRNGISSMPGERKNFTPAQKRRQSQRRSIHRPCRIKDNEHIHAILEDFSEKLAKTS